MTGTIGPNYTPIDPPPPAPPTSGLIMSARTPPTPPGQRWQGGFAYAPPNCKGGGALDACDHTTSKTIPANLAVVKFQPVVLWAGDQCAPWDRIRNFRARAQQLLIADQSRQLAAEFWSGTIAQAATLPNNYLARNDNVDVLNLGSLNVVDALACLEQGLAVKSGRRAMIHCTLSTATHWANERLITRSGQYLVTANDNIVVADAGYPGTGPHGQAASTGHVWAYGTDMVDVRLDDIEVYPDVDGEALERTQNTIAYRAERLAAATWDGCRHVAVEINEVFCSHTGGS